MQPPTSCRGKLLPMVASVMIAAAVTMTIAFSNAALARETPGSGQCAGNQADPFELYGETIRFKVLRDGSPVGMHSVAFTRKGEDLIVESDFDVEVKMLFVTAYRYEYRAIDTWRNGCLKAMRVWVNDDGARHEVVASAEGGKLIVDGPDGRETLPLGLFPTHHWHAGVLGSAQVLNTITGRATNVQIADRGVETVIVNGEERSARRFAYSGDLRTEVWYDELGRWVKMRFVGSDGSTIEYVCETCARDSASSG